MKFSDGRGHDTETEYINDGTFGWYRRSYHKHTGHEYSYDPVPELAVPVEIREQFEQQQEATK